MNYYYYLTNLCFILLTFDLALCSRDRYPEQGQFRNFDVAYQNSKDNLCPYMARGNQLIPVVCWMCHFPYGMHHGNRYVYDCCPGFVKSSLVDNKCVASEETWKSLINYLKNNEHTKTAEALISNTALQDLLEDHPEKVYTVFVPKEDADIKNPELGYLGRDNSARMMVAVGRHYSKNFKNGATIRNEKGVDLKVTTYSNGLTFIECKLVLSVDHETAGGVVHFLDGALPATHRYPTVLSRLMAEPEVSQFVQALPHDLREALGRPDSTKWYTVFAPTNGAWTETVNRLKPGQSIDALVRHHVLNRQLCLRAVTQKSGQIGPTEADDYFMITLTQEGKPAIVDTCNSEIQFLQQDLMSGTGVVHVVDRTMVTLKALDLTEALNCLSRDPDSGVVKSAKDVTNCGLPSNTKANVILLPDEDGFNWLRTNQEFVGQSKQMQSDSRFKCSVYSYHMLTSKRRPNGGFIQQQRLKTDYRSPSGLDTFVTVNYVKERDGTKLGFNGAVAKSTKPLKYRDGVIYVINKINFPPTQTITEIIKNARNMTQISEKIATSGIEEDFKRLKGKLLFLAPIDLGWETRDLENSYTKSQTRKLLQLHTVPQALFGGENGLLMHSTVQLVDSLLPDKSGEKVKLIIKTYPDGNTFIGHSEIPENLWAMVLQWNHVGTDGVVWIIDWPIKCPDFQC